MTAPDESYVSDPSLHSGLASGYRYEAGERRVTDSVVAPMHSKNSQTNERRLKPETAWICLVMPNHGSTEPRMGPDLAAKVRTSYPVV